MKSGTLALLCAALIVTALPASAQEVYPIVFPVAGENHFTDTYNAPRGGRLHEATDIMAAKMTPVVAAADGTVGWMSSTCCTMELVHDDGYQSWYIHLNNDTPGTDDGEAWGFAPGIVTGARVTAGQLIGWVGDSGNAEGSAPHLHFQLHYPDGTRFNPYQSLLAARQANPVAADEIFFYRSDGLFRYYDINSDATLGSPLASGDGYTKDWDTITAINLDGDGNDEMFFYRDDGLFRFYDIRPSGHLPKPMIAGDGYTRDWTSITAVDLDGDGQDEMFFYREDGLFRYYDVRSNGVIGSPLLAGDGYTKNWDAITAVDINGDGEDEMFFYRSDGLYRFYHVGPTGHIGSPITSGSDYPQNWSSITAIDLNGDGKDEMLFYREDGSFGFHPVTTGGTLGAALLAGNNYTSGWNSITSVNLDG
ncbi:MAG TPA: VCBS repeat domain-containing M23 family metallopeptidase [Acidimicrobiia bacterium]|nr:VCBS repeat domain-containing M23 family metallopeptidase [Acidimicrobiia bacterium]